MWTCKYCNNKFEFGEGNIKSNKAANHSRWCDKNPKSKFYKTNSGNRGDSHHMKKESYRKQKSIVIKEKWKEGVYDNIKHNTGNPHTPETKKKLREIALKRETRYLRKNAILYKGVMLDSSWELELAKRLDELNIDWIRPDPIFYIDNEGIKRRYYPDFYLPKYNLYLDPKNPGAIIAQKEKLEILKETLSNLIIIKSLEECKSWSIPSDS